MQTLIGRRQLLAGAGAALLVGALEGCGVGIGNGRCAPPPPLLELPRLRARPDRITSITVCTRAFRAEGPRLDVEQVGATTVVHNYGHGGSGWSLSWGSSAIAVERALQTGQRDIAVIGCGALGITSALLAQRAGARVVIYAKDLPPNVRSSLATGVWTPDSRICLESHATPAFRTLWEGMTRRSFQTYQTLLGLPGNPIEYFEQYFVTDGATAAHRDPAAEDGRPKFATLRREMVGDLAPATEDFGPGTHRFGSRRLRRQSTMMFNIAAYSRMLVTDFLVNGGQIEVAEFRSPDEFSRLRQRTVINATGYGARALFGDRSITPVRGQLARMIPQPDVGYGLIYRDVAFVPRRDGFVFQVLGDSDYYGYDDDSTAPDRAEAELAVNTIAGLFAAA
jgi:glycine/D-amino acid oxidase-like deaminating enzyme